MERQIFGFTPPNPETGQPGYLAAHLVEAPEGMFVRLTIRPHAQENAAPVELALPWTEAAKLGLSIIAVSPQTHDADVNARFARADGKGMSAGRVYHHSAEGAA